MTTALTHTTFTATLVGTPGLADVQAAVYVPPSQTPVSSPVSAVEAPAGVYTVSLLVEEVGSYMIVWSSGGVALAAEDLLVTSEQLNDDSNTPGTLLGYFPMGYTAFGEGPPSNLPQVRTWRPANATVAALVLQHTRAKGTGIRQNEFNAKTSLNDPQIQEKLEIAIGDVEPESGAIGPTLHTGLWRAVHNALLYRTCMYICMSRTPEMVGSTNVDLVAMFKELFDEQLPRVKKAALEVSAGNAPGGSDDIFLGSHTFDRAAALADGSTGFLPGKERPYVWYDEVRGIWRSA